MYGSNRGTMKPQIENFYYVPHVKNVAKIFMILMVRSYCRGYIICNVKFSPCSLNTEENVF